MRPRDLESFRWRVYEGVYRWIRASKDKGLKRGRGAPDPLLLEIPGIHAVLWPAQSPDLDGVGGWPQELSAPKLYSPLADETGLFRTFAETPVTPEGILRFAKKFGHLGIRQLPEGLAPPHGPIRWEVFDDWKREILALRDTIALWEMVRKRDLQGLGQRFEWVEDASLFPSDEQPEGLTVPHALIYRSVPKTNPGEGRAPALESVVSTGGPEDVAGLLQPGNLIKAANVHLGREINERITHHTAVRRLLDDELQHPMLQIVPKNLLGAMWLQFAQAETGNRKHRNCQQCGRWFELSPQARRKQSLYCSDACRFKKYRERQEEAREMHAAGKTLKAIAKQLGSDPETVRGWVEGKK